MKFRYISEIEKKFKICYIHNPKGFFQNLFWIDEAPDGRLILMGTSRDKSKNFKKVAILKKKENKGVSFLKEQ